MKKYKLIYCLILSIFLVGCTANYNVNITENGVEEYFEFTETDNNKWDVRLFSHTDITYRTIVTENFAWPTGAFYQKGGNPYEPIKMDGVEYYNQELINNNEALGIKYDYTFKLDDYNQSNAVRSCFKNFSFSNGNKKITIYAKDASNCFNGYKRLENININLTSSYKVISHNADKVENGKYIWNVDAKDASDKKIETTLTKDKNYVSEEESQNNDTYLTIIIAVGIFIVLIGGTALYLYFKNKNASKL